MNFEEDKDRGAGLVADLLEPSVASDERKCKNTNRFGCSKRKAPKRAEECY